MNSLVNQLARFIKTAGLPHGEAAAVANGKAKGGSGRVLPPADDATPMVPLSLSNNSWT
jgi:hypothetical protein